MLRRLFSIWLIACILGYGSVWAFDSHAEDEASQHETLSIDFENAVDTDDQSDCDHCCHAAAHMTGLWTVHSLIFAHGKDTFVWPYDRSYRSLQAGPPYTPPIS